MLIDTLSLVTKRANMVCLGLALIFLSGCSANTWVYDSNEKLMYHIKTDGKAIHKLKTTDIEIDTDSKTEPLFKLDLNGNKVGK